MEKFVGWIFDAHSTQYNTLLTDYSIFNDHRDAFLVLIDPNGPIRADGPAATAINSRNEVDWSSQLRCTTETGPALFSSDNQNRLLEVYNAE